MKGKKMSGDKEIYWKGDKAKLTGEEVSLYGAEWLEYVLLEGHKKGQKILVIKD